MKIDKYMDYLDQRGKELGIKHAVFSAYSFDEETDEVTDTLKDTAMKGSVKVVQEAGYWGDSFESDWLLDPTWEDLWLVADQQIKATGDDHHIYIEGVEIKTQKAGHVELLLGSHLHTYRSKSMVWNT